VAWQHLASMLKKRQAKMKAKKPLVFLLQRQRRSTISGG
jgi:hypothetical protein